MASRRVSATDRTAAARALMRSAAELAYRSQSMLTELPL